MKPIAFLLGLWTVVYPLRLNAEKKQLICRNLTEANGLSDNRVTCFFKDRTGFMWIGTENGLNRYDGHSFVIYRPGQESFTLSNEFITGIGQDENGMLWVATKNGLNRLDVENDSLSVFLPLPPGKAPPGGSLANNLLRDLYTERNKVWLAIDNRDLGYFDTRTNEFIYFPWKEFLYKTFPRHVNEYAAIQAIEPGYPNGLWLGTTMGLFGFDTLSRRFEYIGGGQRKNIRLLKTGTDASGKPVAVFQQEEGELGIYREETGYAIPGTRVTKAPFLKSCAQLDLWLNIGRKLFRYDSRSNTLDPTELAVQDKLSAPYIRDSFSDETQGSCWLATDRGCYIYSDYLNLFPYTRIAANNEDSPLDIRNALSINDSTIWLVDFGGQLIIRRKDRPVSFIRSINGIPLKECTFLFRDSEENLWVLAKNHLLRYSRKTGSFSRVDIPFPGSKVYYVMREDHLGNFWVGTINSGVYIWRKAAKKWEKLGDPSNDTPWYVRDILVDKNRQTIWVATYNLGLVSYDTRSRKIRYYSKDSIPPNGMLSSIVTCLAQSRDSTIWAGTESGGLSRYDGEVEGQAKFTTFTTREGLPENTLYGMLPGVGNGLWISSAKGLIHFDGKEKVTHQWLSSSHPVIKPDEALLHADPEKGFILPVEQGFVRVRWPGPGNQNAGYPLIMTGVSINDTLTLHPVSEIPYHKNQIGFSYQLLRYDAPADVFYEHMLEGLEKTWKKSGGIPANTDYFNLPPGAFTFRVRATDALGNLLSEELRYGFTIGKPLWMRWELWLAGILVLVTCAWLLWRRQVRQLADERIINYFATSLYGRNTVEDVFWDIAKNCISQLGFEDCVLYQCDEERGVLVQKAAYGPKNPEKHEILNPIVIPLGNGITGYAALHGKHVLVPDTSKDSRYILDDQERYSELAVPIFIGGKVFGVIDTEHPKKNFYTRRHVRILQKIAGLCNQKLTQYLTEEKLRASIARDLHDEIGSTLTSINIISKIAIEQHNHDKVFDYLSRIKENSSTMMDAMSDMVWAINPENDSLNRLIIRLKEFCSEIFDPTGIAYFFDVDGTLLDTRLTLSSRKDLYLILKEAVTNAAKYSRAGKVSVSFRDHIHAVRITVEDNGVGTDLALASSGNGLRNMRYRAAAMRSELMIESKKGEGMKVIVNIPV
ncbi:MAG: hypothetical protein ABS46_03765 [Cytophagaceae bacterium SCN 52-12]|nr:MAG: hypothetical protein ABS46_03765 [Cytophagaceae bacterium SCN 52-12]